MQRLSPKVLKPIQIVLKPRAFLQRLDELAPRTCAVVRSVERGFSGPPSWDVYELVGPRVYALRELVQLAAKLSGVGQGRGRPVIGLPRWMGQVQAVILGLMPGEPVMSLDNLDSMRVDNVASGHLPGFEALGMSPSALAAIAPTYLLSDRSGEGLLGVRRHAH